jgi:starch-binding outer membrane protein, SusD/RagB family
VLRSAYNYKKLKFLTMRIKSILLAGSLSLLILSCKKEFLNLEPYDQIPLDAIIKNENDMQAAVNGAYAQLRDVDLFGRTLPLIGDLLADNVFISTTNSNRYIPEFTYAYINTHGNALNTWNDAYNAILRANNVINSTLLVTAISSQLKGEALTLRALMHFTLVNLYAKPYTADPNADGVPIILQFDPALKPARSKVSEVYTQIEKDLNDAFGLMTNTTKSSSLITKYVAKALLARVYLYKGDWNNAKTAALDVVNNGGYTLVSAANLVNYWKNPSPVTSKIETIFEISADGINNNGTNALAYFYDPAGYGDAICADDLYNKYTATDVRRGLLVNGVRASQNVRIVNKYSNTSNNAEKDDTKIMRYAEVLLILAEAYARTSDGTNALLRLNQVAQQRDPSFAGYSSSGTDLIEDVINERRKELAFEGDRFWDLNRLNRDVTRVNINNNYPANAPLVLAAGNQKRVWPIPQNERDANPNISQNTGY